MNALTKLFQLGKGREVKLNWTGGNIQEKDGMHAVPKVALYEPNVTTRKVYWIYKNAMGTF